METGDVVWFPPGQKHWHGTTPTTAMTHIPIQEALRWEVVARNRRQCARMKKGFVAYPHERSSALGETERPG